jgi:hypothetical protein
VCSIAVITAGLSVAALLVAIFALIPYARQWWWDLYASWPYEASAKWLASPLKGVNLRIALAVTNLTTRTARFQVYVQEGEGAEIPLSIQFLDGDTLDATSHIRVGPKDRERYKITLGHPGDMGGSTYVLLQEGEHQDQWILVGPPFQSAKGPKAWIVKYRIWRRHRSRPIEDLGGWD